MEEGSEQGHLEASHILGSKVLDPTDLSNNLGNEAAWNILIHKFQPPVTTVNKLFRSGTPLCCWLKQVSESHTNLRL